MDEEAQTCFHTASISEEKFTNTLVALTNYMKS